MPVRSTRSVPGIPMHKPTKRTDTSKKAKAKSKMVKASKKANRRKK
jgi:hypothetical protein